MNAAKRNLVILAVVALLGGGAFAWWRMPVDYDDCMLSEMKGQHASMRSNAHRKCARRSGREFDFPTYRDLTWSASGPLLSIAVPPSDGMKATRGTFRFSSKECKDAQDADFIVRRTFASETGTFVEVLSPTADEYSKGFSIAVCMKTESLRGVYE